MRAALVALALLAAACSDDGRELAEPAPDQTTTTATTAVNAPSTAPPAHAMTLSSPAFDDGGPLPASAGCPSNVSPALAWSGVPDEAVELALVVTDPDAGGFVHWVVAGIDPTTTGVAEGGLPPGGVQATNDGGTIGWFGPCPPDGETHTYVFRLLAFVEPVGLVPGTDGREAVEALAGALAEAQLTATFARP